MRLGMVKTLFEILDHFKSKDLPLVTLPLRKPLADSHTLAHTHTRPHTKARG